MDVIQCDSVNPGVYIVDLNDESLRILRQGCVAADEIQAVLKQAGAG
jgi:tRNA A37 threonylcarbamoyladenosine synthetase subunit TsaC/SUA5/YrdC